MGRSKNGRGARISATKKRPGSPQTAEGPRPLARGMILAAGLGRRFRPLTLGVAKPAIPFLNSPLISYTMELFRRAQVQELVINLHHAPTTIATAVSGFLEHSAQDWRPEIHFSLEETILGTAGGIGKVRDLLVGGEILVSNAKIYFEQDLTQALEFHRASGAWVTLLLIPHRGEEPYNPVLMDEKGRIKGFLLNREVQDYSEAYVFTGVHILSEKVLEFIPEGVSDSVQDIYPRLIKHGLPVQGFVSRAFWCENSWPRKYLQNSLQVLRRMGLENLCSGQLTGSCTGVVAAQSAQVESGVELRNTILMEGCSVGPNSSLRDVILSPGTQLPAGTVLQEAVVTPLMKSIPEDLAAEAVIGKHHIVWPLT